MWSAEFIERETVTTERQGLNFQVMKKIMNDLIFFLFFVFVKEF